MSSQSHPRERKISFDSIDKFRFWNELFGDVKRRLEIKFDLVNRIFEFLNK